MEAGKELDALVAEKPMGQKVVNGYVFELERVACPDGLVACLTVHYAPVPKLVPNYSTDWSAVSAVVDKLHAMGLGINLDYDHDSTQWHISIAKYNTTSAAIPFLEFTWTAWADTLPHAMCLAALKASGIEVEVT